MMKPPKSILFIALLSFLLVSCAGNPPFSGADKVEQTSSYKEALSQCSVFRLSAEKSVESADWTPFVHCMEKIFQKHPEALDQEAFMIFFRNVHTKSDELTFNKTKVHEPIQINTALDSSFRFLNQTNTEFKNEELKAIEKVFPDFAFYLADHGYYLNQKNKTVVAADKKENGVVLKTKSLPLFNESDFPLYRNSTDIPYTKRQNGEEKEFCKKYRDYINTVQNLKELADYKSILDERKRLDESRVAEDQVGERISERYFVLKKSAIETGKQLNFNLKNLKTSNSSFNVSACLQMEKK